MYLTEKNKKKINKTNDFQNHVFKSLKCILNYQMGILKLNQLLF